MKTAIPLLITLLGSLCSATDLMFLSGENPVLVGKDVSTTGGFLRNWQGVGSGAEWKIKVPQDGTYYFYGLIACPGDQGGITGIYLDGQKIGDWSVKTTRDFNDFRTMLVWSGQLKAGDHTLRVLADKLNSKYLMDMKYGFLSTDPSPDTFNKVVADNSKKIDQTLSQAKGWGEAVVAADQLEESGTLLPGTEKILGEQLSQRFPHQEVWLRQDAGKGAQEIVAAKDTLELMKQATEQLVRSWPNMASQFKEEWEQLKNKAQTQLGDWTKLYEKLAYARRQMRLDRVRAYSSKLIFAKHHVFGSRSGIYLITETEGTNKPSSLCTLDLSEDKNGNFAEEKVLVDPGEGSVRDPELSFDGSKLLYAKRETKKHYDSTLFFSPVTWDTVKLASTGAPQSNYQIYELDRTTGKTRQLTTKETYGSSMEPCYLPNGDIMFSSSRIVQHITCGWGDLSNLFIMNGDGKYARRVGFDQTNTAFPSLLNDGRVVFTRRDYNDRGQSSAHALFVMNSDGTAQTEFYGNQTGLPNSFQHARAIPNSNKVICIIGGYHTTQGGKLALMDVSKGVELDQGIVEMPGYKKPVTGRGYNDSYGKWGEQFSNPYAVSEKDYLVSIAPKNGADYSLYYLSDIGERELLASDPKTSCLQVIPDRPRYKPMVRPSEVDYTKDEGIFYVQNVYYGEAAKGIKPGSVKKIRVIEMLYKNATIGTGRGIGPGGAWDTVMPTGHGLASFDAKRIIGDATVYEDGSAMFKAPARKPLYFQLLDEKNRVIQTMRSWATLMPAEKFSCVGCHEDKSRSPLNPSIRTIASLKEAETLQPFYGPPRAFSFIAEVQPVFDKHCISCHKIGGSAQKLLLTAEPYADDPVAKRKFYRSYHSLTKARPANGHNPEDFGFAGNDKIWGPRIRGQRNADEPNKYISWYTRFELMQQYPPYRAGSIRSGMIQLLEKGHQNVKLTQEDWDKLCAWIDLNIPFAGEYDEANLWSDAEKAFYRARVNERERNEAIEARNIREMIRDQAKTH